MEQATTDSELSNGRPLPGAWTLQRGRALTLAPEHAGVLRIDGGGLWATLDGPHAGPLNDLGDRLLEAGDSIELRAGQRLVIEPTGSGAAARFTWDPLATRPASRGGAFVPRPARIIWA